MQAFKLVRKNTNKYSSIVGNLIGEGADGDVYSIKNNLDKVIKFSVYYICRNEDLKKIIYDRLDNFSLVQKNSNLFAKLYEYNYIGSGFRDTVNGSQEYLLFSCVMEKCSKITEDESKVFHSILSHEDNNLNKNYSIDKIKKMLKGLSFGLEFSEEKIICFVKKIKESSIKHTDIHPRNIMKDAFDNFKFIDFDRITK